VGAIALHLTGFFSSFHALAWEFLYFQGVALPRRSERKLIPPPFRRGLGGGGKKWLFFILNRLFLKEKCFDHHPLIPSCEEGRFLVFIRAYLCSFICVAKSVKIQRDTIVVFLVPTRWRGNFFIFRELRYHAGASENKA
jgi:hypothetical protein